MLAGVREFLKGEAAPALTGRNQFLARVAANSLDIALRDLALGPEASRREMEALGQLVGGSRSLSKSRETLCRAIRFGEIDLQRADLHAYLRQSVFAQVMIDQPGYAGAVEAGKQGS